MKHAGHIFGIAFITVLFLFLVIGEIFLLDANPPQLPTHLTMEQWIENFERWAFICVVAAIAASILWYILARSVFKANNQKSYGKRGLWGFLFLLPVAAIIASILLVEKVESSLWLAYVSFIVNGLLPYYLATLLFSPVAVKYTPIGAKGTRSLCPW